MENYKPEIGKNKIPGEKEKDNSKSPERFSSGNPYIVLGVSENFSAKEIVSAWKKLLLEYHPDKSKHPQAKEISQYLNRAIRKLVGKDGALLNYNPDYDAGAGNDENVTDWDFGFPNVSDEEWYVGDRYWEILNEAEKGKYSDERLRNKKEANEEKEFILSVFNDPEYGLDKNDLIMTGWDDDGRFIDKEGNVTGNRDFTNIGQSIRHHSSETVIRHKKRIYNSKGEIVFDGSKPEEYIYNEYGSVILPKFENETTSSESEKSFIFPNIKSEIGEIERIANLYSPENPKEFMMKFFETAKDSKLVTLSEELWSKLENTDSYDINKNDWGTVAEHTNYYNKETGSNRNWSDLREKIENGTPVDAPIILDHLGTLHLVSGNTRLMVTRATGKKPLVLIVKI
ncbi:MAG: J domain-containing protein [Candidatus Paceibacterota bacterium]